MTDKTKDNKNLGNDENKVNFTNDQLGENSTEYYNDNNTKKSNCGCNKKSK